MKLEIYLNGKKVSKRKAEQIIGKERLENRINDAKETYTNDPYTKIEWMDGMEIKFK